MTIGSEHLQLILTVLGLIVSGAIAYGKLSNRLDFVDSEVRRAHSRCTETHRELTDHKERQAGELVDREILRELEGRIGGRLDRLEGKIDRIAEGRQGKGAYPAS